MLTTRQKLHKIQSDFFQSDAPFRIFCGGRGSGKTFIGAFDLIVKIEPRREYGCMAPDYTMLSDIDIPELIKCCERLSINYVFHKGNMTFEARGSIIHLRSLDNPDKVRGHSWARAWIDEGSLVPREAYDIVLGCLRSDGQQGKLSITGTPKGRNHWTYEITRNPEVATFNASSTYNPFLPPGFVDLLRSQYGSVFAQQEIEGRFIDFSGGMFKREWFEIIPEVPAGITAMCRFWDMAATEPKNGSDPDWTVGCKLGFKDGVWYVLDIRRARILPLNTEQLIRQTALIDGFDCCVRIEQEGGSSGKSLLDHYARNILAGFDFEGIPSHTSKELRAAPVSAAAQAGNVKLIQADWNTDFINELEAFSPTCAHDDIVDATSGAFSVLAKRILPVGIKAGLTYPAIMKYDSELDALISEMTPEEKIEADKIMRANVTI